VALLVPLAAAAVLIGALATLARRRRREMPAA
jgi:hypothetical protein